MQHIGKQFGCIFLLQESMHQVTQKYSYNHDSIISSLPKLNYPKYLQLGALEWINYSILYNGVKYTGIYTRVKRDKILLHAVT